MSQENTKGCSVCKSVKPLTDFYYSKGYPNSLCKECAKSYTNTWRNANKKRWFKTARKSRLKRVYGLTPRNVYNKNYRQRGACAICGKYKKRLVIDHSHRFNIVRDLLCDGCNGALGHVENKLWLSRAHAYIDKHSPRVMKEPNVPEGAIPSIQPRAEQTIKGQGTKEST